MIALEDAVPARHVFYQQPHMPQPEYGVITSVSPWGRRPYVHVRFLFDHHSKACRPEDLHWPPDFRAGDGANPPGQIFGHHPHIETIVQS